MAYVCSWLLRINGNPGPLLVQCIKGLHWLGFGLIADGFFFRVRMPAGHGRSLAAGAFPGSLFFDKEICKGYRNPAPDRWPALECCFGSWFSANPCPVVDRVSLSAHTAYPMRTDPGPTRESPTA